MSWHRFKTVKGIVDWRLCLGCGACAYICPEGKITLVDVVSEGIRPLVANEQCGSCTDCLTVCPAHVNDHRPLLRQPGLIPEIKPAYGPALELWEGYAADPEIRRLGSSGGLLTALSLYCLEREGMHGVVHIAGNPRDPIRNCTRLSRTRAELLAATGSRYAPASACDSLGMIETAPTPCVFIGQPSEVTALRKAEALRPALRRNVGLTLSFFCAGSPATRGTEELLRAEGIPLHEVAELRYRGRGWPGWFAVRRKGETEFTPLKTYEESWGFLQRFRPFAVHLTPDSSGEDADISCGDPWYRPVRKDEAGFSLVVTRTERGRELLRRAREAGYVHLEPMEVSKALQSQVNLIRKRGAIWGRVLMFRLFGLPVTRLRGYSLFRNWLKLPLVEKGKSTLGTARRILQRGYRRPLVIAAEDVVRRENATVSARTQTVNVHG
ncbi:MAG TPA: Coenzyme F420 hydrogenase/dehydrogenase, beta subunit C-terminal domain [Methylomirabilota bacterium]|nr:Coenzyme F420 hydrogenase/dehydrogenase, beta subunit C-terminal domain [Methylomirabilota bacterium]